MQFTGVVAAPASCRLFLFRIPPPAKKSEWKRAAEAEGDNARYSARGGILSDRGVLHWFASPRTRRVRISRGFC